MKLMVRASVFALVFAGALASAFTPKTTMPTPRPQQPGRLQRNADPGLRAWRELAASRCCEDEQLGTIGDNQRTVSAP